MAPRTKPANKASAQPKSAALPGLRRPPTKQAKKKAADLHDAEPEFSIDDDLSDFDHYQQWVRRADKNDPEISSPIILGEWDRLPDDHATAFADVVRAFRFVEDLRPTSEVELRKVLQRVSDFKHGDERHDRRRLAKEARELHKDLSDELKLCQETVETVLQYLDDVDAALVSMPREGLRLLLETYQQELRKTIDLAKQRFETWRQYLSRLVSGGVWTPEDTQKVQDHARVIERGLATAGLPSQPAAGSSSSSSKRKQQSDTEEPNSKAPRRSQNPKVAGSESARSGASPSEQRSRRPRARNQNGAGPVNQDIPATGLQSAQENTGHHQSTRDGASAVPTYTPLQSPPGPPNATQHGDAARDAPTGEPQAAHQPPPFLTIGGVAGHYTAQLYRDLSQPSHSTFLSWCRRQFTRANYRTLEECEPLAEACVALFRRTLSDHDWENESDMPPMPMNADDSYYFKVGSGNGRMWGNTRRLSNVRRNAPLSFLHYCNRNVARDLTLVDNADSIARQILQLVQRKGLSHDWENEKDVVLNEPPPFESTKNLRLEGLNPNTYWNFRGKVGAGGNGRALLYCKYDSAGNLLQRLISKESFVSRYWNWPTFWSGPIANRIPMEAGLHRLFPRNPHIIEYLGFHVNKQLRMVRHYTVFAELGDLSSLYDNHAIRVNARDEHGVALPPPSIPAVAIICMFQAMAAGACMMAHGAVPDDEGRWPGDQPPDWRHSIIHRDIKPLNYFLSSSESPLVWHKLPIVALGDFGNGIDTADPAFAQSAHDMGTPRWMAPEQLPNAPSDRPVSAATNVYQIGLTILNLMHLKAPSDQANYDVQDQVIFPAFPNDALLYPQDLIDIAEDCVQMNPADRPTPVDLYKSVRDLATSYPDASSKTIPWQLQTIPADQPLRTPLDKWAV